MTANVGHEIAAAVRANWSEQRCEAARAGVRARRRRRVVARAALGAAAAAVIAVVAWQVGAPAARGPASPVATLTPPAPVGPPAEPAPSAAPLPASVLRLTDGSTAVPADGDSELRQLASAEVELARGGARFEVAGPRSQPFRVISAATVIEAYGVAAFACTQIDRDTLVEVTRGTVIVRWAGEVRAVSAGERATFPPPVAAPPSPVSPPRARVQTAADWRDLAHDGDYDRAYAKLHAPASIGPRDATDELLLAADVARLSHHPTEALAPLRRVVRDHAADPRASLAAFTLGRVLLEELGRPPEAATAFADVVRLAPDGPMVEDAIAREVEALSRAGDPAARRLAEEYVAQFPAGRKLRSVRRFGGLE